MLLYRQVGMIIFILFLEIVLSKYFILDETVEWTKARQRCSVPSAQYKISADDITDYSENTIAWTSSSIYTSYLTDYYGCMDVNINLTAPNNSATTKLNSYFPNSMPAIQNTNVFECAYHCTPDGYFFAFIGYICKCIDVQVLHLSPENTTSCLSGTSYVRNNKHAVFSKSDRGLPIFRFKRGKDWHIRSISRIINASKKYYCVVRDIDAFKLTECELEMHFFCEDKGLRNKDTWFDAINTCLFSNKTISKTRYNSIITWYGEFMYIKRKHIDDSDNSKRRCIALLMNSAETWSFYKYKNCSDYLPILCKEVSNSSHFSTSVMASNDSLVPVNSTESAIGTAFKPSFSNKGEIIIVNIVLVGLVIFVIMLIILRKHFNMQVCQTDNQKSRSNAIHKKPMAHRDRNSVRDNEDKSRAAHYNESWELRHNIVHLGQLNQQDIITVQLEETET